MKVQNLKILFLSSFLMLGACSSSQVPVPVGEFNRTDEEKPPPENPSIIAYNQAEEIALLSDSRKLPQSAAAAIPVQEQPPLSLDTNGRAVNLDQPQLTGADGFPNVNVNSAQPSVPLLTREELDRKFSQLREISQKNKSAGNHKPSPISAQLRAIAKKQAEEAERRKLAREDE